MHARTHTHTDAHVDIVNEVRSKEKKNVISTYHIQMNTGWKGILTNGLQ
jgi:hypothetical protein